MRLTRPALLPVMLAGAMLSGCAPQPPEATRIDSMELLLQPMTADAIKAYQHGGLLQLPPADATWSMARLPVRLGRDDLSVVDVEWQRAWYRVRYPVTASTQGRLAVYVPRFMGGFADVDYLIDGRIVDSARRYDGNQWNRPAFFVVPPASQQRGEFELLIAVWYQTRAGYMLAAPHIGLATDLAPRAAARAFLQTEAPQAMSYALLVLGLFAFGFWVRRRSETTYLLFALATIVWFLRTLHYYTGTSLGNSNLFWWISLNSLGWLMLLVYAFALRLQGQSARWPLWTLCVIILVTGVVTAPILRLPFSATALFSYVSQFVVALAVTGLLTYGALRRGGLDTKVLAGALWINLAFGAHDLLLFSFRLGPESVFLMPYGALFLFGAFLFAVTRRYANAIDDVERSNASLEARLRERTRDLELSHERLRQVEKERAVVDERQRLMREMHDGLGSSLMSSLVLVEQGRLGSGEIAAVLRECIDDLKLTIDSLEPIGRDLVTLLATLRYRLGRRLEAAGLRLDWCVGDLPPLPWLDAVSALQVLRIVQEALTNVIKHARASSVTIATTQQAEGVCVTVADDGSGCAAGDVTGVNGGGRGLSNMRRRAEQLGGRIEMASDSSGTRIALYLPLDRRSVPQASDVNT